MNYLISGSMAYDSILIHKGSFHTRLLPQSLASLNVTFGIEENNLEFGGCGGNIAYNANLLGDKPFLCMSVGSDAQEYLNHFKNNGIETNTLTQRNDLKTPHAWIMSDEENNQLAGFYKGAMKTFPLVADKAYEAMFWHLAPEYVDNTAKLAILAIDNKIDYFLDPGPCLAPFLEGKSNHIIAFNKILSHAKGIFLNDYETELLQEKTGKKITQFLEGKTQFIIQTLGSKGLFLHTKEESIHIGVAKPNKIINPTGCGDAFRAGFAHGYLKGWSLKKCAQLGSIMGSFAIENSGGQNHKPSYQDIMTRMNLTFSNE